MAVGQRVEIILASGELDCVVDKVKPGSLNNEAGGGSNRQSPGTRQKKN